MAMDRYISADSHVLEPADLWIERMEQSFRDQAPRIVLNPPGFEGEYWLFGDREPVTAVQGFFAGASRDSYDEFPEHLRTARYTERLQGSYDPAARLLVCSTWRPTVQWPKCCIRLILWAYLR